MQDVNPLVGECVRVLGQGAALLRRLPDGLYGGAGRLPATSAVGGHFRHCADFYQSFLAGVGRGRIDYNRRGRDALVERDRSLALTRIEALVGGLRSLRVADGEARVLVSVEGGAGGPEDPSYWCRSTVARELQYLLGHTVHHYALVALMLRLQGFEPGEEFGVAPSTLKHRGEVAACAR